MKMRVLVATDGSSAAEVAIELAGNIAWPPDTELRLVTVVEPIEPILSGAWALPAAQPDDTRAAELESRAQNILEHAAGKLVRTGLDISRRVMRGRAASKIVENARDFAADLIIVGNRGHGTISSTILGSVSSEVVDQAPCPVLVARGEHLTRAVLGHDGSPFAQRAEGLLVQWPIFDKVEIEVTSVAQLGAAWTSGLALSAYEPPIAEMAEARQAIIGDRRHIAEAATRRLQQAGRRASGSVVQGDPATELIRHAASHNADLIVVGTHGRTGLMRLVLGSVARNVMLHARCSVLVVRDQPSKPGEVAA